MVRKGCGMRLGVTAVMAGESKAWCQPREVTTITAVAICWALQVLGTVQCAVYTFSHLILTLPPITETEAQLWESTCQGHTAFF